MRDLKFDKIPPFFQKKKMQLSEIENSVKNLVDHLEPKSFIYDFLLIYGTPQGTISRLKKGINSLKKKENQIIVKKKIFFEAVTQTDKTDKTGKIDKTDRTKQTEGLDLAGLFKELVNDPATSRHKPRFIMITDGSWRWIP